jgi:hypothetical protein
VRANQGRGKSEPPPPAAGKSGESRRLFLTAEQVKSLSEEALLRFLELRIEEGHHVDYKRELGTTGGTPPTLTKDAKREFQKDGSGLTTYPTETLFSIHLLP